MLRYNNICFLEGMRLLVFVFISFLAIRVEKAVVMDGMAGTREARVVMAIMRVDSDDNSNDR